MTRLTNIIFDADLGSRAKRRKKDRFAADAFMEEVLKEWAESRKKEDLTKGEEQAKLKEIRDRVSASENEFLRGLLPVGST